MKDLIKKQEIKGIIDSVKNPFKYENTLTYNPYEVAERMIEELLRETVEYVCDKMTGTERLGEGWSDGYNARIEEEEEIKQNILKEIK